jgi:cGMP-dependent protein kinase
MLEDLMMRIRLQDTSVTMKDLKHKKVVGAGAAGVVRLVEHTKTKTRYALKRVMKQNGKIPEEVARECVLLKENDHPFIMTLVKTFETAKSVYMLTELITGGELHAAIRTIPTVLSRSQAQFYTGSLVLVLEETSDRNIVYRDLKPENVMLDAQGYLKLIDFGIAKKLKEGQPKTFTMIGTPHYMAPEVMRGHGYSTEIDVWSLGVMLFEFVCGYLPFADDLDEPTEVCTAVLKDPLNFPSGYRDKHGRELQVGMLTRQPKKRIGSGINGYDDIKNHEFFKVGHEGGNLFNKILGRELTPPVVPKSETYCDPEDVADIYLSDAEELAS